MTEKSVKNQITLIKEKLLDSNSKSNLISTFYEIDEVIKSFNFYNEPYFEIEWRELESGLKDGRKDKTDLSSYLDSINHSNDLNWDKL